MGMVLWEDDGRDAAARRVPAAHAEGDAQPMGLLEPHVASGGTKGAWQGGGLAAHEDADVRCEVRVGEGAAVQEGTLVVQSWMV